MILIDSNQLVDIELVEFEQVEIKGKGHPDTLCDLIAETASRMYSRYCIKEFGAVANHWFDKVMLIGGASEVSFGSSFLVKPYEVIFAGKVSNRVGEHTIPLDQILFQATSKILTDNLIAFDPSKGLVISNKLVDYQGTGRSRSRYQPSSTSELQSLNNWHQFESNDCNLVSSYSPLSRTEFLTKKLEEYFNGAEFKEKYPSTGTDIKIFSSRHKESLDIIANIPFIGRMVKSPSQYNELKDLIIKDTESMLSTLNHGLKVHFILNPHDKNNNFYLTSHGSAADTGDVGVVGRGNRINGLITPMRPMSIEAPCGKNPLDHTGKLYGILSMEISQLIFKEIGVKNEIHIFTKKGDLLTNPHQVIAKLANSNHSLKERVSMIIADKLKAIDQTIIETINTNTHLC